MAMLSFVKTCTAAVLCRCILTVGSTTCWELHHMVKGPVELLHSYIYTV